MTARPARIVSSLKYFKDDYVAYSTEEQARLGRTLRSSSSELPRDDDPPAAAPAMPPGTPAAHAARRRRTAPSTASRSAVPKGTLIIRAAEQIGIEIPRFCDHPLLDPAGACRQCLVEVEGQRKPVASCTTPVADGMVVQTQLTSPVADKAQQGIMELLLINHPLDCPICDKGGECPLQNQAMSNGRTESRFVDVKREYPKPLPISSAGAARPRAVRALRRAAPGSPSRSPATRSSSCSSAAPWSRSPIYEDEPFESYFSGNTMQICPVGALTSAQYRFRARPFDLRSEPSVCEHCASGCAQRTDYRRGKVMRRLAGEDPAVNEEWNCDKGRSRFRYATPTDRLTTPLVRGDGRRAARGLLARGAGPPRPRACSPRRANGGVGVLPGGRLTVEDAYAYAKFARVALGTNDIDFRARAHSAEEVAFLAAGSPAPARRRRSPTRDLDDGAGRAARRLRAGGGVADRLPAAAPQRAHPQSLPVFDLAPFATPRPRRSCGPPCSTTLPGAEAQSLRALGRRHAGAARRSRRCAQPGAVILVGERLAEVPGALLRAAWRWPGRPAPAGLGAAAGR